MRQLHDDYESLGFRVLAAEIRLCLLILLVGSLVFPIAGRIVAQVMIERFMTLFQRHRGALVWMLRASGVLLIAIGRLMITGSMTMLTAWLQKWTPGALRSWI